MNTNNKLISVLALTAIAVLIIKYNKNKEKETYDCPMCGLKKMI